MPKFRINHVVPEAPGETLEIPVPGVSIPLEFPLPNGIKPGDTVMIEKGEDGQWRCGESLPLDKPLAGLSRWEDIHSSQYLSSTTNAKSWKETRYMCLYDRTPRGPTEQQVLDALRKVSSQAADQYMQYPGNAAEKAVRLWTADTIYRQLNAALLDDLPSLDHWIWLCRSINTYLIPNGVKENMTTWRGSKVTPEVADTITPGMVMRCPYYVASSPNIEIARKFAKHYMVKINIPKGSHNACGISHLSVYTTEDEILIPPYTPFKCVRNEGGIIEYDVLDGMVEHKAGRDAMVVPGLQG